MWSFTPNASWITITARRAPPSGTAWYAPIGPSVVSRVSSSICMPALLARVPPQIGSRASALAALLERSLGREGAVAPSPRMEDVQRPDGGSDSHDHDR